eukprot:1516475-Rhodomonas_salina.1
MRALGAACLRKRSDTRLCWVSQGRIGADKAAEAIQVRKHTDEKKAARARTRQANRSAGVELERKASERGVERELRKGCAVAVDVVAAGRYCVLFPRVFSLAFLLLCDALVHLLRDASVRRTGSDVPTRAVPQ